MHNQGRLEYLAKKEKVERLVQTTTTCMVNIITSTCNIPELSALESILAYTEGRINDIKKETRSASDEMPIARFNTYNISLNIAPAPDLTAREQSFINVGQQIPSVFGAPGPTDSLQKRRPETRHGDMIRKCIDATSKISTDDFVEASLKHTIRNSSKKIGESLGKIEVDKQDGSSEDNESMIECIQQSMTDVVYRKLEKASVFCREICSKYEPLKFLKDFSSKFGNLPTYIQVDDEDDLSHLKLFCPSASDIWRYYTSSKVPYDHFTVISRFNELSKRIKGSFSYKAKLTPSEHFSKRKPSTSFKEILRKLSASAAFPSNLNYVDCKETFFRANLIGTPDYLGVTRAAGKITMAIELKEFEGKTINRTSLNHAIKQSIAYAYLLRLPKAHLIVSHNQSYKLYVTNMDTEVLTKFSEEVDIAFRNMTVFWLTCVALLNAKQSQPETKLQRLK